MAKTSESVMYSLKRRSLEQRENAMGKGIWQCESATTVSWINQRLGTKGSCSMGEKYGTKVVEKMVNKGSVGEKVN